MVRTQVLLTEDQYRRLKRWANRLRISLSQAVRRCVGERLASEGGATEREGRMREALGVIGKYADSRTPSGVAEDHDDHLAKVFRK